DRDALGDYKSAIADYTTAIQLAPNDPIPYLNRGADRAALGDYKAAIADQTQAIRLRPDYADAYENRGQDRQALGDTQGRSPITSRPPTSLSSRARPLLRNARPRAPQHSSPNASAAERVAASEEAVHA